MLSNPENKNSKQIDSLIAKLSDKDGMARKRARDAIVDIYGSNAVPSLINSLSDSNKHVRWESAKALSVIGDPRSIPILVQNLTDKNFEIRWLAAEGLVAMGHDCLKLLLKTLQENPDNWYLREGTHNVLHSLRKQNILNESCLKLLDILHRAEVNLSTPVATEKALKSLK